MLQKVNLAKPEAKVTTPITSDHKSFKKNEYFKYICIHTIHRLNKSVSDRIF